MTRLQRRRFGPAAFTLLALIAAGCGSPGADERKLDTEQARVALTQVLDAWKAGKPHGSTSELSPPVRAADEDWLSGARLVDYKIDPAGREIAAAWEARVTLDLVDKTGRKTQKTVAYLVMTEPELAVIRQEAS